MAQLCQVLVLMAAPAVVLLTLRFVIVRQARLDATADARGSVRGPMGVGAQRERRENRRQRQRPQDRGEHRVVQG